MAAGEVADRYSGRLAALEMALLYREEQWKKTET